MQQAGQWAYPVGVGYPDAAARVERHLRAMQRRFRARDQRWEEVRSIRCGDFEHFPDVISDAFPRPIVQNFIDTTARDLSEMLAPLPSFNCTSASMRSDEDRKKADLRTKIVTSYMTNSRMDVQMLYGADHYWSYGMMVMYAEPDFEEKQPRLVVEDPTDGYPEWDRWDRLRTYTKRFFADAHVLAMLYPEYEELILKQAEETVGSESEWQVEMIRYWDHDGQMIVLGGKHPLVLERLKNKTGRIPVVIAKRPGLNLQQIRGQFDDVVWVQLARDMMSKLQFEAVEKAVQAPLALPPDVQDLAIGPDAILRSQTPEKIRRVGMEMTNMSFLESNTLLEDLQAGSRYPAARTGSMDASVVTGRGTLAMMSGLDQQLKAAQVVMRSAYMDAAALCFEMDEKLWPSLKKDIKGVRDGTPFQVSYTPAKAIAGDRSCDVTYGFGAGLDPSRAIVAMLQLRAEKAISRDLMMRNIPFQIDVVDETVKVNVEDTRDALMQAMFASVQSIPALAAQGMDPTDAVLKAAAVVKGLQKGKAVEDVITDVYAPKPQPAPPMEEGAAGEPGAAGPGGPGGPAGAGVGGPGGGLQPSGLMQGVAPGQAGMAPGGRPDLNMLLAGLSGSGQPEMSARVSRRRAV